MTSLLGWWQWRRLYVSCEYSYLFWGRRNFCTLVFLTCSQQIVGWCSLDNFWTLWCFDLAPLHWRCGLINLSFCFAWGLKKISWDCWTQPSDLFEEEPYGSWSFCLWSSVCRWRSVSWETSCWWLIRRALFVTFWGRIFRRALTLVSKFPP